MYVYVYIFMYVLSMYLPRKVCVYITFLCTFLFHFSDQQLQTLPFAQDGGSEQSVSATHPG